MHQKKEVSQKIVNYAIWYYLKYFPSINKLIQKLDFKFGPKSEKWKKYWWIFEEDIDYIINKKLKNILVEKEIIDTKVRNLQFKWKSKRYISWNLYEKWFKKQDFEEIIEQYFIDWEWENLQRSICKKLKSQDIQECKNIFEKLDFKEKTKITQSIIGKWFNYQDIKEMLH